MSSRYHGFIGFGIALLIWLVFSMIYDPLVVPPIQDVAEAFADFGYEFLGSLGMTFMRISIAFLISLVLGTIIGILIGYYRILDTSSEALIDFMRSIPGITLFPLFILLFGVSDISRVLVAIYVGIPIIIINTKYGVINSSKLRKNMAELYRMTRLDFFTKVIIPEASPYIFTGLRIAISFSILVIVVTEMLLGTGHGLGSMIVTSQFQFDTASMFAILIVLGLIGFTLNLGFDRLEKRIFHWR
ncbi:MAG: ABC transporter permease [Nanoarchaeota archaeon]|nr:ABC transporter permease [Nanoarchaeota archaeon]